MRISRTDLKHGRIALDIADCQPDAPLNEQQTALAEKYDEFVSAVLAMLELPGDLGRQETRASNGMECRVLIRYHPAGTSSTNSGLQHAQLDMFMAPREIAPKEEDSTNV